MRVSELCNLRLSDILDGQALRIARLKNSLPTIQQLSAHRGEPLLDEVSALAVWQKERKALGDHSDYLFVSQKGGRISSRQLQRIFTACAQAAGLPREKQNIHLLKHSCAMRLVENHADVLAIRQVLGHRSLSSTLVYTHLGDEEASKALQQAFANAH
jgi:site-specific recombinase XerD